MDKTFPVVEKLATSDAKSDNENTKADKTSDDRRSRVPGLGPVRLRRLIKKHTLPGYRRYAALISETKERYFEDTAKIHRETTSIDTNAADRPMLQDIIPVQPVRLPRWLKDPEGNVHNESFSVIDCKNPATFTRSSTWTPETESRILDGITRIENKIDALEQQLTHMHSNIMSELRNLKMCMKAGSQENGLGMMTTVLSFPLMNVQEVIEYHMQLNDEYENRKLREFIMRTMGSNPRTVVNNVLQCMLARPTALAINCSGSGNKFGFKKSNMNSILLETVVARFPETDTKTVQALIRNWLNTARHSRLERRRRKLQQASV